MQTLKNRNKGQGTTEYIVILAIVVGIAVILLKSNLGSYLTNAINSIGGQINSAVAPTS